MGRRGRDLSQSRGVRGSDFNHPYPESAFNGLKIILHLSQFNALKRPAVSLFGKAYM